MRQRKVRLGRLKVLPDHRPPRRVTVRSTWVVANSASGGKVLLLALEEAVINAENHSSVLREYIRSVKIACLDPPEERRDGYKMSHRTLGTPLPAQMVRMLSTKLATPKMPITS